MNEHLINIEPQKYTSCKSCMVSYRFGFNGKENDNEVKGTGNQLDFGARIYDPRLGRFLSVDKQSKLAPDWTPYRFSANNPILYIDRDGNFEIPIHKSITEAVAKQQKLTSSEVAALSRGVQNADYLGFARDYHFDGRKNFSEIVSTWNQVKMNIKNSGSDFYSLGYDLHTVQDFYAHSNYVELYVQYYKDKGGDMSKFNANSVPLFEDGMKDKEFKENYLESGLKTGEFDLHDNEKMPWTENEELGKNSHYEMNKDSNESKHGKEKVEGTDISYHDLARGVAIKASTKVIKDKKNEKK